MIEEKRRDDMNVLFALSPVSFSALKANTVCLSKPKLRVRPPRRSLEDCEPSYVGRERTSCARMNFC
jgi:hypothetical protein